MNTALDHSKEPAQPFRMFGVGYGGLTSSEAAAEWHPLHKTYEPEDVHLSLPSTNRIYTLPLQPDVWMPVKPRY